MRDASRVASLSHLKSASVMYATISAKATMFLCYPTRANQLKTQAQEARLAALEAEVKELQEKLG